MSWVYRSILRTARLGGKGRTDHSSTRLSSLRHFHVSTICNSSRKSTPLDLPSTAFSPPEDLKDIEISYEPLPRNLAPRKGLLLLSTSIPPIDWPPKIELESALLGRTSQSLKSREIAVNMVYDPIASSPKRSFTQGEETYPARLFFPDGKTFQYPSFSSEMLSDPKFLQDVGYVSDIKRSMEIQSQSQPRPGHTDEATGITDKGKKEEKVMKMKMGESIEIFVCTHGSRDCRCSDRGGPLVLALREEVSRRGLEGKVKIGEIAHVGGHKYAANAVILPSLDMFSNLAPSHAPSLISHLMGQEVPGIWNHWRGRYGLDEAQQSEIWRSVDPSHPMAVESSALELQQETKGKDGELDKQIFGLKFKTWEGEVLEVEAAEGDTLLQVAKKHNLPSMEGTCGGNLECATCHCYLPSKPSPPPIPESSDEELDMLGYAVSYRDGESRLGCQIKVTGALAAWIKEGGVIGLPRF